MAWLYCVVCNKPQNFEGMCVKCADEWRSVQEYRRNRDAEENRKRRERAERKK